jgi:hypothetical protein
MDHLKQGNLDSCLQELANRLEPTNKCYRTVHQLLQRLKALKRDYHTGQIAYGTFEQNRNQILNGSWHLLEDIKANPLFNSGQQPASVRKPRGRWGLYSVIALMLTNVVFWFVAREYKFHGIYYDPEVKLEKTAEGNLYRLSREYFLDVDTTDLTISVDFHIPERLRSRLELVKDREDQLPLRFDPRHGKISDFAYWMGKEIKGEYAELKVELPKSGRYVAAVYFSKYPEGYEAHQLARYFSLKIWCRQKAQEDCHTPLQEPYRWKHFIAYDLGERNLAFSTLLFAGLILLGTLLKFKK